MTIKTLIINKRAVVKTKIALVRLVSRTMMVMRTPVDWTKQTVRRRRGLLLMPLEVRCQSL